jgi:hypothetical protein
MAGAGCFVEHLNIGKGAADIDADPNAAQGCHLTIRAWVVGYGKAGSP